MYQPCCRRTHYRNDVRCRIIFGIFEPVTEATGPVRARVKGAGDKEECSVHYAESNTQLFRTIMQLDRFSRVSQSASGIPRVLDRWHSWLCILGSESCRPSKSCTQAQKPSRANILDRCSASNHSYNPTFSRSKSGSSSYGAGTVTFAPPTYVFRL